MAGAGADSRDRLRVVVVGGGVAGAEALLALRGLAGERVQLTLVSASPELLLRPLAVGESFALAHVQRHSLSELVDSVDAELIAGSLSEVDEARREIELTDGQHVGFDALVIAVGARAVAHVEHASVWWPGGDPELVGDLLRDFEEGSTKRVAFVIPPGAVWPLPLYELAMMTARQVSAMGIDDAELTIITPEAVPLALFGAAATVALMDELSAAGVHLESATVPRVQGGGQLQLILHPTPRRLDVDRVIALPGVDGPAVPGTTQDDAGFILVDQQGLMRDSTRVWAAGDAIAYPVKYGALATQQADAVAEDIARRAGADISAAPRQMALRGVLMTGASPREIGSVPAASASTTSSVGAIWQPTGKVFGTYLTPYLQQQRHPALARAVPPDGVVVEETLPGLGSDEGVLFHALWRPDHSSQRYVQRLGHRIHDYEVRHQRAASLLREHGHLGRDRG